MTTEHKSHLITIRASDTENERAAKVAAHFGLNVSSLVRMLVMREARDLGIEPAAATKATAATGRRVR